MPARRRPKPLRRLPAVPLEVLNAAERHAVARPAAGRIRGMARGPYRLPGEVVLDRRLQSGFLPSVIVTPRRQERAVQGEPTREDELTPVVGLAEEESTEQTNWLLGVAEAAFRFGIAVIGCAVALFVVAFIALSAVTIPEAAIVVVLLVSVSSGLYIWRTRGWVTSRRRAQ